MVRLHNYQSAARRHLEDAESLLSAGRCDNAAYLAGYAAECGVKALAELVGQPLPKLHLHQLSSDVLEAALAAVGGFRRYPGARAAFMGALAKWTTSMRYDATGTADVPHANRLVKESRNVFAATIGALVLDGVLMEVPR